MTESSSDSSVEKNSRLVRDDCQPGTEFSSVESSLKLVSERGFCLQGTSW
jgi:hypothetical protein